MKSVNITELCDIRIGKTPARSNPDYWGDGNKWLAISDMKFVYLSNTEEEITDFAVEDCNMKLVPKNTVVMSFKLSIGKLGITNEDLFTNEAIASFLIKDKSLILPKYLYYALKTVNTDNLIDRAVKGSTLNKTKLKKINIPLPGIDKQKQIIDLLDKAQSLVEKRRMQILELSNLTRSIFLEMFGDPIINNKNHPVASLEELGKIQTGNTPSRKAKEYYGDYIEWIKSDNINTPNHYITKAEEFLSQKGALKGRIIKRGSILVTCIAGSKKSIGNVAITDRDVAFNQQINAITPNENINLEFLYYQFVIAKKLIQQASTNGMKDIISKSNFGKIKFINPPLKDQIKFSDLFLKLNEKNTLLESSLAYFEENLISLIESVFD